MAQASVKTVQVGGVFHVQHSTLGAGFRCWESEGGDFMGSLGLQLLIRDVIRWDDACVARPNATDVSEREQVSDAHQTHAGAVEVHLS